MRIAAALAAVVILAGCTKPASKGAAAKQRPAAAVRVAKVERRDVPFELRAIGNVEAMSQVAVKSRVAGQLMKAHVQDGAEVKEGDLLFEIDPLPFIESVRAAEATLARDVAAERQAQAAIARAEAQLVNARAQAQRYSALFREGVGAKEQMDQYTTAADAQVAQVNAERAALESARAAMKADEARLTEAKLELSYTKIHAPASGRAGFLAIRPGNLVKENDTAAMVTILQTAPVWVSFAIPEAHLGSIRQESAGRRLPVRAFDDAGGSQASGWLDVIDNAVDMATGTIKLKARFENAGRTLWPGQFVNVVMQLRTDHGALAVPNQALQDGPEGRYVWVVDQGMAKMRRVESARVQDGMAVVRDGLSEGETVITFGQLGVRDGVPVRILDAAR